MAKLAIICGAGASYDFLPTYPAGSKDPFKSDRIPLANQLFDNRPEFASIAGRLRRLLPIIPELRTRTGDRPVEAVLEELRAIAPEDPYWARRQRELTSVRFYLREAIASSEAAMAHHSAGISNYSSLINFIERFRTSPDPVIFITFNYDTLIERALSAEFDEFTFNGIGDYVRRPKYKLFKLHGSVTWGHPVEDDPRLDLIPGGTHVINQIIEISDSLRYAADEFAIIDPRTVITENRAYFPALSIPVQKKSHFSCPSHWLPLLDEQLRDVTNLLIIGWSGGEEHFLRRVVPVLNTSDSLAITVVSDTDGGAKGTCARLVAAGLTPERTYTSAGGFTNFIVTESVKIFLRRGGNVV